MLRKVHSLIAILYCFCEYETSPEIKEFSIDFPFEMLLDVWMHFGELLGQVSQC